jgi:hypothetical protein
MVGAERARRFRSAHRNKASTAPTTPPLPSVAGSVPESRLRNLEYDVMLRRAFYTERAPLAEWLHKIADAVVTGLRSFAEQYGPTVANELAQPAEPMVVAAV